MTIAELEELIKVRSETENLEFKEAKNRYDFEKLVGYSVALANEGGGMIILGISDERPRQVVGTNAFDIPEKTCGGIYDRLHFKVTFEEIQHPDGRVLVFTIPSRPTGHPVEYKGRYLMRAGEELVGMSPDQLKKILNEDKPDYLNQIAKDNCSEEDVIMLLDTQAYYDLRKIPYPSTRAEVLSNFETKGFLIRASGTFSITNFGALLFAKDLNTFSHLDRKSIRVIVYDGTTKSQVKGDKDLTGRKGYATGFESLLNYIYDQLPASEEIESALRKTTYAYPKKAIREIVGNAIVHQDLEENGSGVKVEIFDNRIEVTNPGLPILPVDRFIDENLSRNERFAMMLRQLKICEERGHGIDEVVSHIEVYQLPTFFCRIGTKHTTIILSRYKRLRDLTAEERNYAVYQHCCLRYVNHEITNNESIRDRFKIEKKNAAQATKLLNEAVTARKIRLSDPNAANKIKRYVPFWA